MADVHSIFKSQYKRYVSSLKETSFDKEKHEYLCQDTNQKVYDFDKIVKDKFPKRQPSSYDALLLNKLDNKIYCIEFKNQKYSDINRTVIAKKLQNGKDVLNKIFGEHNISASEYKFIYCVVYKNTASKWRQGIEKNEIQFELAEYKGRYFDEIYTNDVQFFTKEYKKHFHKDLTC